MDRMHQFKIVTSCCFYACD